MNCDDSLPDSSTSSTDEVCATSSKQQKSSPCLTECVNTDESEVTSSSELENTEWMSNELINFWSILNDDDRLLIEDVFFKESNDLNKDFSQRTHLFKDKFHIKDKYEVSQEKTTPILLPISCASNNDNLINALNLDIFPITTKCSLLPCKSDSLLHMERADLLAFEAPTFKKNDFKPLAKSFEKLDLPFKVDANISANKGSDICLLTDFSKDFEDLFTDDNYIKSVQYLDSFSVDINLEFAPIDITSNDFLSSDYSEHYECEYINENSEIKDHLSTLFELLSTDSNSSLYLIKSTYQDYTELLQDKLNENIEKSKNQSQSAATEGSHKSKNVSLPKLRRSNRIHENEQRDLADQIMRENQRREQRLLRQFKNTQQNLSTFSDAVPNDKSLSEQLDATSLNEHQLNQMENNSEISDPGSVTDMESTIVDASPAMCELNDSLITTVDKECPQENGSSAEQILEQVSMGSQDQEAIHSVVEVASEIAIEADIYKKERTKRRTMKSEGEKNNSLNLEDGPTLFGQKLKGKIYDKRTKLYKMLVKANCGSTNVLASESQSLDEYEKSFGNQDLLSAQNCFSQISSKTDLSTSVGTNNKKPAIHASSAETRPKTIKSSSTKKAVSLKISEASISGYILTSLPETIYLSNNGGSSENMAKSNKGSPKKISKSFTSNATKCTGTGGSSKIVPSNCSNAQTIKETSKKTCNLSKSVKSFKLESSNKSNIKKDKKDNSILCSVVSEIEPTKHTSLIGDAMKKTKTLKTEIGDSKTENFRLAPKRQSKNKSSNYFSSVTIANQISNGISDENTFSDATTKSSTLYSYKKKLCKVKDKALDIEDTRPSSGNKSKESILLSRQMLKKKKVADKTSKRETNEYVDNSSATKHKVDDCKVASGKINKTANNLKVSKKKKVPTATLR